MKGFYFLSLLMAFDLVTTFVGLGLGAIELNPAPWALPEFMILAKVVGLGLIYLYVKYFPKLGKYWLRFANGAMGLVVVNNVWVIFQMMD